MSRNIIPQLNDVEKEIMEKLLNNRNLMHVQASRFQVVLNRAKGKGTNEIAEMLHIHPVSVSQIVRRFNEGGIPALLKQPNHKPGLAPVAVEVQQEICRLVSQEKPKDATHWSTRMIAKQVGISHTKVHQILQEHGLKPHLVKRFRISTDPQFQQKLEDVVGLYLNPPENALILCLDEKSQIQALERTQPILPLREGIPERQTHDYWRHGVTNLYAALDVVSGKVIGACMDHHRHQEYIKFLKLVDRRSPKDMVLHLIVDNISSHKTQEVQEYLQSRNGRFVIHYTPTHSSWLNLVERWLGEITTKRIRRGSWTSVKELERAILDYIHYWNKSGKRFVWTKSAGQILQSIDNATRD
jgi:transposase